jgi:hypothetical protein
MKNDDRELLSPLGLRLDRALKADIEMLAADEGLAKPPSCQSKPTSPNGAAPTSELPAMS